MSARGKDNGNGRDPPGDDARLRPPPHSVEAEQSVLGGLLLDNSAFGKAVEHVSEASFYVYAHRLIFGAISTVLAFKQEADVITVFEWLRAKGLNEDACGLAYLTALAQSVPSAANISRYAEIVGERASERGLIAGLDEASRIAWESAAPLAWRVERISTLMHEVGTVCGYVEPVRARTLDLRALASRPAPDRHWFVPGWLHNGPLLFAAGGGVGKTLLAQQAATAGALGLPCIGQAAPPFRSLLWACEDDADELWRRQEAISRHFDISLDAPADNLVIQSRMGVDNLLMSVAYGEMRLTQVYEQLRQQVNDLGIDVFWADNLAHLFGGDENARGQVTMFINALAGLVIGRPFSVALLAHTARHTGSEFAGSAAWENAVRMRWYLGTTLPDQKPAEGADDDDVRYLAKRKANYTSRDYVRFTMTGGVLLPDQTVGYTSGLMAHLDKANAEKVTLEAFHKLRAMGVAPSDTSNSRDYLPKQAFDKKLSGGYTQEQIKQAMDRLMSAGKLARGVVGVYANRGARMGLVLTAEGLPGVPP